MNFMQYLRSKRAVSQSPLTQREINPVPLPEQLPAVGINPYAPQQVPVEVVQPDPDTAKTIRDIVQRIDPVIAAIEQLSGIPRKELFMQGLKSSLKGGGLLGLVEGLTGQKPPVEAKLIRYAKVFVTWGLIAVFFGGLILITLVAYAHFMTKLMGV
jgi:hypothetical protein